MKHSSAVSYLGFLGLFVSLAACAQTQTPPPDYPGSHSALCRRVGLESVESPQHSSRDDRDSTSLLAVYTFDEPNVPAPKQRWQVKAQADHVRRSEAQTELEGPATICTPEALSSN